MKLYFVRIPLFNLRNSDFHFGLASYAPPNIADKPQEISYRKLVIVFLVIGMQAGPFVKRVAKSEDTIPMLLFSKRSSL